MSNLTRDKGSGRLGGRGQLVGLALGALIFSASGPALAQTETSSVTTTATAAAATPAPAPEPAAPVAATVEPVAAPEPAPSPPPEAAPAPVKSEPALTEPAKKPAGGGDQAKNQLVRNIADAPVGKRPWYLSGTMVLRTPVVTDQDAANDRALLYVLQAGHTLGGGKSVFAQASLRQAFVAEVGDSAFRFSDVQAGFNYSHQVDLKGLLGIDRQVTFFHRAAALFPTSRASQNQDLIIAPRLLSRSQVQLVGDLYLGITGLAEYRWHEFAERKGNSGASMNTQFYLAFQAALEYQVISSARWGTFVVGVDTYGGWNMKYASQASAQSVGAPVEVRSEEAVRRNQPFFGWDLYVQYVPIPVLAVGLSMESGEPVFTNGVHKLDFFDRELTQLAVTVTGRY